MPALQGWKAWQSFRKLSWEWRNLVVYSESGQDWHQFSGLIEFLNRDLGRKVCYLTSDADDPAFSRMHQDFRVIYLPAGLFLTLFFQFNQSDVLVLTMMDLNNLHLKRSLYPVHYVYLFHSLGSTHMVDHANSFDHYDSLFCAGPHQVAEIRRREALMELPAKNLFDYGHPRLEQVMRENADYRSKRVAAPGTDPGHTKVILVAPTWGSTSIFNVCGTELLAILLNAGFRVVMRPHYQSIRQYPALIRKIRERFQDNPCFEYIDRMAETESILRSDLLISDWSAMAIEYSLGLEKPVLFIDVPRRIRNPDWQELGLEPIESSIREKVGAIARPEQLHEAPAMIWKLLNDTRSFARRMRQLRGQTVFRLGHSLPDGAAEIARLADHQRAQRLRQGELRA